MGFDGILVNHASLNQAADDMALAAKAIENRLDQFDRDTQPLRDSGQWDGQATSAYQTAHVAWLKKIVEMNQILAAAGDTVAQSNLDYARADLKGAQTFEGIV